MGNIQVEIEAKLKARKILEKIMFIFIFLFIIGFIFYAHSMIKLDSSEIEKPLVFKNYEDAEKTLEILESKKLLLKKHLPYQNEKIKENSEANKKMIKQIDEMILSVKEDIKEFKVTAEMEKYNQEVDDEDFIKKGKMLVSGVITLISMIALMVMGYYVPGLY